MNSHKMKKSWNDGILHEGSTLQIGETSRQLLCPRCNGGMGKERAFNISRSADGLLYFCHRASCDFRGFIPTGRLSVAPTGKLLEGLRKFNHPIAPLPIEMGLYLHDRYGLTGGELNANQFGWWPDARRVILPMLDDRGSRIGILARSYNGDKPKTLRFWEEEAPKLAFPAITEDVGRWYGGGPVVVVEDMLSAIKVQRHSPCVALCGTWLGHPEAVYLSRRYNRLFIMLDPGAEQAALRIQRNYGLLFDEVRVLGGYAEDPKDLSDDKLLEVLR